MTTNQKHTISTNNRYEGLSTEDEDNNETLSDDNTLDNSQNDSNNEDNHSSNSEHSDDETPNIGNNTGWGNGQDNSGWTVQGNNRKNKTTEIYIDNIELNKDWDKIKDNIQHEFGNKIESIDELRQGGIVIKPNSDKDLNYLLKHIHLQHLGVVLLQLS